MTNEESLLRPLLLVGALLDDGSEVNFSKPVENKIKLEQALTI